MKALVGAFNQEKALVRAFSMIVKTAARLQLHCFVCHGPEQSTAPHQSTPQHPAEGTEGKTKAKAAMASVGTFGKDTNSSKTKPQHPAHCLDDSSLYSILLL